MFLGYQPMMRNQFLLEEIELACNIYLEEEWDADVSPCECMYAPLRGTLTSSNNLTSRFLFKRIN